MDNDRRRPDRGDRDGRDYRSARPDDGSIARTGDDVIALTVWVVVCFGAGILGSFATPKAAIEWYPSLVKPWFTPPGAVFAPIWTVLYLMMAVAVWRVGRAGAPDAARWAAVAVFIVQLALNMGWSWAFFAGRSPGLALVVILVLLDCVALVYWRFRRIDELAGRLILPYLGWVGFAALLNLAIVLANR